MARYENMTAQEIGETILASQERNRQYVEEMTPIWQIKGKEYKKIRIALDVSLKHIANLMGVSEKVIAKLEKGESVSRRRMIERSYRSMLKYVQAKREIIILRDMVE